MAEKDKDYKKAYRTIIEEHFPDTLKITIGEQTLLYMKKTWTFYNEERKENERRGLRYGENPGQEAAIYELVNGNLVLGECSYIEPGNSLVSGITEKDIIQA